MNALLQRLNLPEVSPFFDECCAAALAEPELPVWLTEEFLRETAEVTPIISANLDLVIDALPAVTAQPDLVLFAKVLYRMLGNRQHHEIVFKGLEFPKPPEGQDTLAWDIFSVYPMLARVRQSYEEMCAKGVPEHILSATFGDCVGGCVSASTRRAGRTAFIPLYFLWCTTYSTCAIYKLGLFSCEIRANIDLQVWAFANAEGEVKVLSGDGVTYHRDGQVLGSAGATDPEGSFTASFRETEDAYEGYGMDAAKGLATSQLVSLPKALWKPVYAPGDSLISLHIPAGNAFTPEIVESALKEAKEFFQAYLPERNTKGFMCISWLLAPELDEILRPTSNILLFKNLFYKFPTLSNGVEVCNFVFEKCISSLDEIDVEALPAETSLARSLKALYQQGRYLYETGGLIPFL